MPLQVYYLGRAFIGARISHPDLGLHGHVQGCSCALNLLLVQTSRALIHTCNLTPSTVDCDSWQLTTQTDRVSSRNGFDARLVSVCHIGPSLHACRQDLRSYVCTAALELARVEKACADAIPPHVKKMFGAEGHYRWLKAIPDTFCCIRCCTTINTIGESLTD